MRQEPFRPIITSRARNLVPSQAVLIPAQALMVFTRRNLGWRFLNLPGIALVAVTVIFLPDFGLGLTSLGRFGPVPVTDLSLFAITVMILTTLHSLGHLSRGPFAQNSQHAYHSGDPYLSFLPVRRIIIVIVIEPLLLDFLGWKLYESSYPVHNLGFCIIIGACTLAVFGFYESRYQVHRVWTDHDLEREAEAQAATRRQPSRPKSKQDEEVLHAGAAQDSEEQPYRRRGR